MSSDIVTKTKDFAPSLIGSDAESLITYLKDYFLLCSFKLAPCVRVTNAIPQFLASLARAVSALRRHVLSVRSRLLRLFQMFSPGVLCEGSALERD
jgi:hypothetical protein